MDIDGLTKVNPIELIAVATGTFDIVFKLLGRSLCDYTRFWFTDCIFLDHHDCLFYNVYLIVYASPRVM